MGTRFQQACDFYGRDTGTPACHRISHSNPTSKKILCFFLTFSQTFRSAHGFDLLFKDKPVFEGSNFIKTTLIGTANYAMTAEGRKNQAFMNLASSAQPGLVTCTNFACLQSRLQPTRGADTIKLLHCDRCYSAAYCSSECQRAHWPFHASVCKQSLTDIGKFPSQADEDFSRLATNILRLASSPCR